MGLKAERKKAAPQQETPQEAQQPEQQPGPSPEVEQEEPGATEPETEAEAMPVERNDFWSRATFQIDLPTKQGGAPNFQLLRDTLMMLVEQVDSAVELAKFAADNEVHLRRLKDAFPSYETLVTTKFMEIGKRLAGGQ